jgi:hypothetical protein
LNSAMLATCKCVSKLSVDQECECCEVYEYFWGAETGSNKNKPEMQSKLDAPS